MCIDPAASRSVPVALCLGGLDPSAGAGIVRDALTAWELGVQPMVLPVAETRQNGFACLEIAPPALDPLARLEALAPHLAGTLGVKLGLCALSDSQLRALVEALAELRPMARIWDPIQAPTSGVGLHEAADLRRMAVCILGKGGWVVSPNRLEAAAFAGLDPHDAPQALAVPFLAEGAEAVWLKGGHANGAVEDHWVDARGARSLGRRPRLPGDRRGTGCTLAAAWLAFRLLGKDAEGAARRAGEWLHGRWDIAAVPGGAGRPCFAPVRP